MGGDDGEADYEDDLDGVLAKLGHRLTCEGVDLRTQNPPSRHNLAMAPYVRFVRSIFSAFLRRNFLKANHVPTAQDR